MPQIFFELDCFLHYFCISIFMFPNIRLLFLPFMYRNLWPMNLTHRWTEWNGVLKAPCLVYMHLIFFSFSFSVMPYDYKSFQCLASDLSFIWRTKKRLNWFFLSLKEVKIKWRVFKDTEVLLMWMMFAPLSDLGVAYSKHIVHVYSYYGNDDLRKHLEVCVIFNMLNQL